jgi:ubiquitin C-terminal hydrolase
MLRIYSASASSVSLGLQLLFTGHASPADSNVLEKLRLLRLPTFLFIQIDRHCVVNGVVQKDCRYFEFPLDFDVASYCLIEGQIGRYVLCAVVSHIGIPGQGACYYVAFCKVIDHWYCFNDSSVSIVQLHQVTEENFPRNRESNQTAMLLVYERWGRDGTQ